MPDIPVEIVDALHAGTQEALYELMENHDLGFAVDWREEDTEIVAICEGVLKTGKLSAELVDADTAAGFEMFIHFGDDRRRVPLVIGVEDRHITLHTLNQMLLPEYEIRCIKASLGSDMLFALPLPCESWRQLERDFPDAVARHFLPIEESPNLFTDPLDHGGAGKSAHEKKRPWWKFW